MMNDAIKIMCLTALIPTAFLLWVATGMVIAEAWQWTF